MLSQWKFPVKTEYDAIHQDGGNVPSGRACHITSLESGFRQKSLAVSIFYH
jgi:hypothetical protein